MKIDKYIPNFIHAIHKKVRAQGGEIRVHGETLCDILLEQSPTAFQLICSLDKEILVEILEISLPESHPISDELELFYRSGKYHIVTHDFLPDMLDQRYSIEIITGIQDITEYLESKLLSTEKISWDFNQFYSSSQLEEDFAKRILNLTDDIRTIMSSNIPYLIRYVRLCVKYGLDLPDPIIPTVEKKSWRRFPNSHVWKREFIRLLELSKPAQAFEVLRVWEVLPHFFSELLEGYMVMQNEFHEYDVYYHSLSACDAANPDEPHIRLAALFHDIGKPRSKRQVPIGEDLDSKNVFYDHENIGARMTYQVLKKFGFHHATVTKISKLVRLHMFHYTSEWTDSAVRRLIRKANIDLPNLFKLRAADRLGSGKKAAESRALQNLERRIKQIQVEESRVTVKSLAINGNELMAQFKLTPGPIVGKTLNHLLQIILDDQDQNNPDLLMIHAKEYLEKTSLIDKAS